MRRCDGGACRHVTHSDRMAAVVAAVDSCVHRWLLLLALLVPEGQMLLVTPAPLVSLLMMLYSMKESPLRLPDVSGGSVSMLAKSG